MSTYTLDGRVNDSREFKDRPTVTYRWMVAEVRNDGYGAHVVEARFYKIKYLAEHFRRHILRGKLVVVGDVR